MRREAKFIGWFALVLGCAGSLIGASILVGGFRPTDGLSCKAICGLTLLATQFLGSLAGDLVGGILWLVAGALFFIVGYKVLHDKHCA